MICTNGMHCGEHTDGNNQFITQLREGIRLFNKELDGFEEEIPELKSGEIYLPLGLKSKIYCEVGDTLTVDLIFGQKEEFIIKGFVQEPAQGSMMIGWKQIFVCKEDYDRILETCKSLATEEITLEMVIMMIYRAQDCELPVNKLQRQLNLDTGIASVAVGTLNEEQSLRYSTLLPDIVMDIVMVFAVFLFAIILIVMSHSIGTEIEIDYTTLGILKAQGFTEGKIRLLFVLQYLLAQVGGMLVGSIVAIPLEREISKVCQSITAVLPERGLSAKTLLFVVAILVSSILLILLKTRRLAKISPVRAISGGREEVFFESRLNAPITKRAVLASLSLRQLTSAKKRYFGALFIVAILTFCMITVNLTGNLLSSRRALSAMGMLIPDINIYYTSDEKLLDWEAVDKQIETHSGIELKNRLVTGYASLNGENLFCEVYEYPEYIVGILEGRAPLYENEVLITEMVADTLELKIGDEVTVTLDNGESQYMITGIFQSQHDSGMSFAMNFAGAKKGGVSMDYASRYYVIEDKTKLAVIAEEIQEEYGDYVEVTVYDEEESPVLEQYGEIVALLKLIIYALSILFALVVVHMVCTKTFIQERTDIGIYKAMGFTSHMLRLQFAVRFLIIALIGSFLGAGLSVLLSARMLGVALSLIGLSKVVLEYTLVSVLVPAVVIGLSFFIFAFLASAKIKRVAVRELVVE